jgi:hypothetical protein
VINKQISIYKSSKEFCYEMCFADICTSATSGKISVGLGLGCKMQNSFYGQNVYFISGKLFCIKAFSLFPSKRRRTSKMSRSARMTKKQKELLISVLESKPYLIQGRAKNGVELQRFNEKWNELAEELNKVKGARKTSKQWREVSL